MRKYSLIAMFGLVLGLAALAGCEDGGQQGQGGFNDQPPAQQEPAQGAGSAGDEGGAF